MVVYIRERGKTVTPMGLCLTRDELAELTRCRFKAGQVTFLVMNGIRHYLDAHGWPVVTRAAIGIGVESDSKPIATRSRLNK
jgi:hypothetical protein